MPKLTDHQREFDVINLELLKVACPMAWDRASFAMANLEIATTLDPYLMQIRTHVLGHEVGRKSVSRTVEFEADYDEWESWWQHTKAVHFPTLSRWLRRPPRQRRVLQRQTRTVVVDLRSINTFPDARIAYPEELVGPYRVVIPKQFITTTEKP